MQAHVDDRAELVNDSLWHWKPVKVISDCRCNAVAMRVSDVCCPMLITL